MHLNVYRSETFGGYLALPTHRNGARLFYLRCSLFKFEVSTPSIVDYAKSFSHNTLLLYAVRLPTVSSHDFHLIIFYEQLTSDRNTCTCTV